MATRVFDRRGRQNWDDDKRENEDRRMLERRTKSDRRGGDRRKQNPWPEGVPHVDKRSGSRRIKQRRSDPIATEPETKEANPTPSRKPPTRVAATASLIEAIAQLSSQKTAMAMVIGGDKRPVGILSESDVIRAIAENGENALKEPVSKFMKSLAR
jgi:hypothetical protein